MGLSSGCAHPGLEYGTIAAISVLGPSHRLTSEVLPALGEQVKQVTVEISTAFGYSPSYPSHNADQMV